MLHQGTLFFNGGEITPYLALATPLDKHASSVARMENYLPMPFGGFRNRPGALHLTTLDASTRIEPFNFSGTEQFIIAVTTTSLKIFNPAGTLVQSITTIRRHPTNATFAASFPDPFALQFTQVNDIVTIYGAFFPLQLSRQADNTWNLEEYPYSTPPLLDENLNEAVTITTSFPDNAGATAWASGTVYATGARVTYSGSNWSANGPHTSAASGGNGPPGTGTYTETVVVRIGRLWSTQTIVRPLWSPVFIDSVSTVGGEVTLTCSVPYFSDPGHIGAYWRIAKKRAARESSVDLPANDTGLTGLVKYSAPLVIQGGWVFNTNGTWYGTFSVELSRDRGVTWEEIRSYESDGDNQAGTNGFEKARVLMRIKWDHVSNGTSSPRAVLGSTSAFITGYVRITSVVSSTVAKAICIQPVEATTTSFWNEGAFSPLQGYPRAGGVHDRRIVMGGTAACPLGLWLSKTDDLRDFAVDTETATDEDGAIFRQLASRQQDPILWIASQKFLFVGTAGGEWVVGSENTDKPISPVNFVAREHTNYGSAAMGAIRIGATVIFLERQRRRVREFAFVFEQEQYDAADLTRLAEHITESGIVHWGFQANREPTLWAVRADGCRLRSQISSVASAPEATNLNQTQAIFFQTSIL